MARSAANRQRSLEGQALTRDGEIRSPFDLDDAEFAVWQEFSCSTKAVTREVVRLRELLNATSARNRTLARKLRGRSEAEL